MLLTLNDLQYYYNYYHCLMAVVCIVEVSHYVSYGHKLPDKAHSGGRDQNSYIPTFGLASSPGHSHVFNVTKRGSGLGTRLPLASVTSLRTMLILVTRH